MCARTSALATRRSAVANSDRVFLNICTT